MKRLTQEEFMERFYIKNETAENIEILGEYVNNKTKIKCKCKIDGYEFEMRPNSLLNNQGCPKCAGRNKTTEEFKQKMKEVNDNIEILGEYKGSKAKIKCKCKLDGYEWEATPSNLLNNHGCPKCVGKIKNKTTEYFINELKKVNDNVEILGEYKGSNIKIKCRCKLDGYEWEVIPSSLLREIGCPKCGGNARLSHKEFINRMKEINSDIEILGEYKTSYTKIKCRCKLDGYEWEAKPSNLLSSRGCPKCNESKGEKRIGKYLDSRNIEYKREHKFDDCRSKNELPFDFYIPSLNIVIEYDGEQHFKIVEWFGGFDNFVEGKIRDTIKTIYCKENNIKLIRIAYWDFDKIEEILEKELED